MLHTLVISLPLFACLFWAVYFIAQLFKAIKEPRVMCMLVLFYMATTILYFDHWLYFSGIVSVCGEWSYGVMNLCVYPLYYSYLRALTRAPQSYEVPVLLLPALVAVFLFPIGRFGGYIADHTLFLIIRICFALQVLWVLFRGSRLLVHTIRRMDDTYSDDRSRLLRPTYISLVIFCVTAVASIILNFMGRDFFAQDASVTPPAIVMSVLLYVLGFVASQTVVPKEMESEESLDETSHTAVVETDGLIHKIDELMKEQELFRNSQLTIHDLARAANSNRTYVSAAINKQYNVNFSTYVNRFRVEAAKRILTDSKYEHDKEAIADAIPLSGFQTDQTFYRVFKELTGTTPLLYRRSTRPLISDI